MTPRSGTSILNGLRTAVPATLLGPGSVIRGVGFWTAILLPVLYIPLVLISHPWVLDVANFAKVVGLHVASILVGNGHGSGADAE